MGGGFGWLGRNYGFNADTVVEANVITADGGIVRAGNFGTVASLEFSLYPITEVYGGGLFYPVEKAPEVLALYSEWIEALPDEMTTTAVFLNFPPFPEIPEPLRGGSFIAVKACYSGGRPEDGEELILPLRELGEPLMDTFRVMPYEEMDMITMDPVDPVPAQAHVERLDELGSRYRPPARLRSTVSMAGGRTSTGRTARRLITRTRRVSSISKALSGAAPSKIAASTRRPA